jgi:DNA-binding NarL/FixJ family response regulator
MITSNFRPPVVVAVAHCDPYVAAGISALLRPRTDLAVLAPGQSDPRPEVLVIDYDSALQRARAGGGMAKTPASLIVTEHSAGWQVRRAVDAGIRGYLVQDCSSAELAEAVRCVAAGRRFLSPAVTAQLLDALYYDVPTARQLQVLDLIAQGMSNKDIGRRLGIGERTVKTHVKSILVKLGERTRTAAMAEARRRGMLVGARNNA